MNLSEKIREQIKKKLNNRFIRNVGWLTGTQLILRVFRLLTTVIVARFLTPHDFGLAAIAVTTNEFMVVFTRIGIGGKLIQADEENLDELCNSAYWLNWALFFGLFVVQCLAAFPVAWFYRDSSLILPICVLAIGYLVSPIGRIQTTLIQRENRLKITAISDTLYMGVGSLLAAVFAPLGFGMWTLILARLLPTPIEPIISLKYHPWRSSKKFTTKRWGEIFKFGFPILGSGLLNTLRENLDYLIVGRFVGVNELGIYYFAFNAGLGISLSIIQSVSLALLPHLCAFRSDWQRFKSQYFGSLKTVASIIVPFVLLQSSLAPFYVPVVFGSQWKVGIPILILICLSAIPRAFAAAAIQLMVAIGKPDITLWGSVIYTVVFVTGILIGVYWQAFGVAVSVLITNAIYGTLFTIWATRYVFRRNPDPTPNG